MKAKLPKFILPAARLGYRFFQAHHYYPYYILRKGHAKAPFELTFEITYRCNLRCIMCPLSSAFDDPNSQIVQEWKNETELTKDEIFKIVREGAKLGVKQLTVTGGEPFLRKDLIEVIAYTKQNKMSCSILSNGTLIDEHLAYRIVESGLDLLTLSVDGPPDVHNRIRNSSKAFERTINAARLITQAKKRTGSHLPSLGLVCTISAANIKHLLPLVDIASEVAANIGYGHLFYTTDEMARQTATVLQIGHTKGENQNVPDELKNVDPEALHNEIIRVKRYAKRKGVIATFCPDLKRDEIKRRYFDDTFSFANKCFYPWYAIRINPYGAVYPCSMNITMGNIREVLLHNIWNNEKYVSFRKTLKKKKLFPKCAKCCKLNNKLWKYLPKL